MFQYAEKVLNNNLEKKREQKIAKEAELNEVQEKLDDVAKFEDLKKANSINGPLGFFVLLFALPILWLAILAFTNYTKLTILYIGLGLSLVGGLLMIIPIKAFIYTFKNCKEIKDLKKKGVKKNKKKKEYAKLLEKKESIKKEKNSIEADILEDKTILEYINFAKGAEKNPFYLADSEEEYRNLLKEKSLNEKGLEETEVEEKVFDTDSIESSSSNDINKPREKILCS